MKIDEIKDPQIRALAWKYRKTDKYEEFNEDTVYGGFDWVETEEGDDFWWNVNNEKPVEITEKMKADHPEIFLKEEEMKNEFNFKVGDKVTSDNLGNFVEITAIGKDSFLGINSVSKTEVKRNKTPFWRLHEEPKEKVKLTKFYCSDNDDDFMIKYYKTQSDAPIEWSYVYTEKEFLEKFDVEL